MPAIQFQAGGVLAKMPLIASLAAVILRLCRCYPAVFSAVLSLFSSLLAEEKCLLVRDLVTFIRAEKSRLSAGTAGMERSPPRRWRRHATASTCCSEDAPRRRGD